MPPAWAELAARELEPPDQTRYGRARTDPLGRDAPGWHVNPNTMLPTRDPEPAASTTTRPAPMGGVDATEGVLA